jgi:glycosyltransferase involved in cell wall biosynthesis
VKVAFVVNDLQLSGGVGVVVAHARQLVEHHGFDVTLVLARQQDAPHWRYDTLDHLHVATRAEAQFDRFDVAVGTWWETAYTLFTIPSTRYAFFVQSLEDRFYLPNDAARYAAPYVLDLPVAYITEARWIADTLADLRPEAPCYYVRNGIDKATFAGVDAPPVRVGEPLRVLIEGNPDVWFKRVHEAAHAARQMREPHHVTLVSGMPGEAPAFGVDRYLTGLSHREMAQLYSESDVVLKLSSVEGMFGPPLEAFHMGTTCVVTPVTGHEEYVLDGVNGLVADWDDTNGAARLLDLLARDRRLLYHLRWNALETARAWPTWEQQGQLMAMALRRIREADPPSAAAASARLMADSRGALEAHADHLRQRNYLASRVARFDRVLIATRLSKLLQARRHPIVSRVLRLARRLSGR